MTSIRMEAATLAAAVAAKTAASPNEQNLRHEVEILLEGVCRRLKLPWTAYQLDRTLWLGGRRGVRFVDVVHGAVVIEYEPPSSFRGRPGAKLEHARRQAEEYCDLLSLEEGRVVTEYLVVAWDGAHISFGRNDGASYVWDALEPFTSTAAERLLMALRDNGVPLVHPQLLGIVVGPTAAPGAALIPAMFKALTSASDADASSSKTQLLYAEWRRLFGQVIGIPSDGLQKHLLELGAAHGCNYLSDPPAYLFSLNTYIALVAKLVAAMALPGVAEDITDGETPLQERIDRLESGQLFVDAGITNMLNGDFFSWYAYDVAWPTFAGPIADIAGAMRHISFDVTRKDPQSTRDLFKGLYMTFAPRGLRHALGEFYTPDWLAAHALDEIDWQPTQSLLDPTCGTGTFILEGLRRRLAVAAPDDDAATLLGGLYGTDLNPLAVLAARASLVVFLAQRLRPGAPVQLPVYLADAVNPAQAQHGYYTHRLQTELGNRAFQLPEKLVEDSGYFALMHQIRELLDADLSTADIAAAVASSTAVSSLDPAERAQFTDSVAALVLLHQDGWDGIWCSILADRFAAGAVPRVDAVVGNPPWVKWSHLPPDYIEFIKPRCVALGVFSDDSWVGGIESDISTVITYEALEKYCTPGGKLAFFITGTVFANESSQGFRRWQLPDPAGRTPPLPEPFTVVKVEDYAAVAPFEGVSNHATLLILERNNTATSYPVTYKVWQPPRVDGRVQRQFTDAASFRELSSAVELRAQPVPGSDAGPWLKGTAAQLAAWAPLFGRQTPAYRARKGITTDANGVFFIKVAGPAKDGIVKISNDPTLGRRALATVQNAQVEAEHVFPLLRGEGVAPFKATPDSTYRVLIPQRGMHGDPDLATSAPKTYRYLNRFRAVLQVRSSYRRFQRSQPWWSLWSTGEYTFSPFKVVWQEMSGGRFAAAYVGSHADPAAGSKVVVPDHKVYFVPVTTEDEAAYLTGFLNAPLVSSAVAAYAAALSLGASVVEYLLIPTYDAANSDQLGLVTLAKAITASGTPGTAQLEALSTHVAALFGIAGESD